MKISFTHQFILLIALFTSNFSQASHWGEWKDNGCKYADGVGYREYASVLWGIPWGHSWERACRNKSGSFLSATGINVSFDRPSGCVKSTIADAAKFVTSIGSIAIGVVSAGAGAAVGAGALSAVAMLDHTDGWPAVNMWGIVNVPGDGCGNP